MLIKVKTIPGEDGTSYVELDGGLRLILRNEDNEVWCKKGRTLHIGGVTITTDKEVMVGKIDGWYFTEEDEKYGDHEG